MRRGCDDALLQAHPSGPEPCVRVLDRDPAALAPALFQDHVPSGDAEIAEPRPGDRRGPVRRPATIPADMFLMGSVPSWAREPRRRVVHAVGRAGRRPGSQVVYYCHETLRLADNVALWMALWLGQHLTLPVAVIMVAEPVPSGDLRAWMTPPHVGRRLQAQRALRDALRAWGVPVLLFQATDPIGVLRAYVAAHQPPHVVVTDEFVARAARQAFDVIARTWSFPVFAFSSGLACSGLFALDAPGEYDAGAVRRRFLDDVDRIRFDMPPSKVPEADVQAPLFVVGTRRVFLDADLVRQLGMPDVVPAGIPPPSNESQLVELGLVSPFSTAHLVDDHVRRQRAIWMATRSVVPPVLPGEAAELSIGFQEVAKATTCSPEFNALQERLRVKKFLVPDERRRWARLLWQLVRNPIALTWAGNILETYATSIRRPILEFELYLDMTSE